MHEQAVFDIEVDVAIRRPPSPENIVTTFHRISTDEGEIAAHMIAHDMAVMTRKVVMATAIRTTGVEI